MNMYILQKQQLIEHGLTSPPRQNLGYLGDSFTGQKTQPTVSKYWRNTKTVHN